MFLSPFSFAFCPFLLSCFLCGFPSSSVSSFLLPPSFSSSFPFHFFFLALSSFPIFVFLFPALLSSPFSCSFSSFGCPCSPLPSSVPLLPSSVFSCFSSLPLSSTLLSSIFFSSSFFASWVISFLYLFLLYQQFLQFLLFSFSSLFLSLACSFFFGPFSRALLLSFLLGFVSLSVFRYSFFRFPLFVSVISFFVSICFSFLSLTCLFLCSCGLSFVFRFSLLLPYFLLCRLHSSAVCIPPRFGYLLLAVRFGWVLPASPFLRLVPLLS